jgi:V8-like Glu-specific endopeptidase
MRTLSRRHALAAAVTSAGLVLATAAATGGTAATASAAVTGGTPAAQAVTQTVGRAAQSAARSFWTRARMESATPAKSAGQLGASPDSAQPAATKPPGVPNPVHFNGVPTVGALFFNIGIQVHFCTASVVDSSKGNLVLTAAHCVYGSGLPFNIEYVPQWHHGVSPYGAWPVSSITVASGWKQSQNPSLDFAFLTVTAPPGTKKPVQQVTGGLRLGINTGYAHPIYVIGYNDLDAQPVGCATKSFEFEAGQMEFYCNSFFEGVSGGPWITGFNHTTGTGTVIGNIGGFEQGGDESWACFSDYYTSSIQQLYTQAQRA